mmetsp:Transcript_46678/g.69004  ORF Transcript_46678/g.69004 Transcript_46678/m.69004 type:complete len:444 (-) Transcript_46678:149-1480(-)|eukprot:CAMPEP_0195509056 /NCGR_PEP_ID=MMETSP0794_2-20130614/2094_1 /TAXON_ID=515487 /ORGANISM="Stephanopyxis turris, Strain CCMP 815" /LENGTH=443 /DNA_ID=CAMNT_0040636173 /DNA_START=90 /DNA_END=1421 /DNA_ORIENTATION=+
MLRFGLTSLARGAARTARRQPSFARRALSALPDHEILPMPALSPTMTEGNIASWTVAEGDAVNAGDAICEIETDKATVAFETTDDGYIAKILVPEGSEHVPVGTPVAVLVEEEEDVPAFAGFEAPALEDPAPAASSDEPNTAAAETPAAESSSASTPVPAPASSHGRQPLIKFRHGDREAIAAELLRKSQAVAQPPPPPRATTADDTTTASAATGAAFTDIPASNMRKIIASRLAESKSTIPHFYVSQECDITELTALRKSLATVTKVSLNDFVLRASALALRDVSVVNRSWDEVTGAAKPNDSVDISVAVATEGGLITPIVTNADQKTVSQISSNVKELAGKAKAGTLAPSEYQGGSFSISNLGMFGIDAFSAVINPPQGCIMAVGGGIARLERCTETGGVQPRTKMKVKLSCDRRVVDEAMAAQLLQAFRHYMEQPQHMLL